LLKIIGGSITPEKGSVKLGANVKIGFLPQEINFENPDIPAVEDFSKNFGLSKSASISFLHKFLFLGENYNRSLGDLSLGEKAKYQLAKMIAAGSNFLLLDEPTNHLDFPSLSHVEEMLSNYAGTILVVSHDRAFLENIGVQKAFWLSDGILKKFHNLEWK
jgi:ATPase subunit of ABC transporter with duplicated ATPase domains